MPLANPTGSPGPTGPTGSTGAAGPPGTSVLAVKEYSPSTQLTPTTASTTFATIDATNVAVTFVAPTSGEVMIDVRGGLISNSTTAGANFQLTCTVGGGPAPQNNQKLGQWGQQWQPLASTWRITGLTAGTTYTYALQWAANGGTASILIGGTGIGIEPITFVVTASGTAPPNIPGILAITQYGATLPSPNANYTATGTMAALDATNLSVTFTAPASGKVLVTLSANVNVNGNYAWGLLSSGTTVAADVGFTGASWQWRTSFLYVTGLTPGTSYTYQWAHKVETGTGVVNVGKASAYPEGYLCTMKVEVAP